MTIPRYVKNLAAAGLVGGFLSAVLVLHSADAYQSPSSAAAFQALQKQGVKVNGSIPGDPNSTGTTATMNIKVDRPLLGRLYQAVFRRGLDSGADAHIGKNLSVAIDDIFHSDEARQYGELLNAVKAYENAQRMPGTLSASDRQAHTDAINNALASLTAWIDTLPKNGEVVLLIR